MAQGNQLTRWDTVTIVVFLGFAALWGWGMVSGGVGGGGIIFAFAALANLVGVVGIWVRNNLTSRIVVLFPLLYAFLAVTESLPGSGPYLSVGTIMSGIVFFSVSAIVNEIRIFMNARRQPRNNHVMPSPSGDMGARLRSLEELKTAGLLTDEEYQERRQALLSEV